MQREKGTADFRCSFCIYASKTISRVLYLTVIYLDVPLPVRSSHPGSGRASLGTRSPCSHTGVAPDRVYSIGHSRADGCALTAPFHPYLRYLRRSISVALFLRSLWAGVTRYPCPVEPGLSSQRAFRLRRATVCLTRRTILAHGAGLVNGKSIAIFSGLRYTI